MAADVMVTGATGQIGGAVSAALARDGVPFAVLVRDASRLAPGLGAEIRVANYRHAAQLERALAGMRKLLLIVPDEGVELALAVVDAAVRAGVQEVVRISAIGASAGSKSELLRNHAAGEAHLEHSGLRYTHLRCNSFFQNVVWFRPWIEARGEFYWCGADAPVAWVDARDVARAAAAALTGDGHAGAAYDVTGPAAITWSDMAVDFSAALLRPVRAVQVTPEEMVERAETAGWGSWMSREWVNMFTGEYAQPVAARVSTDVRALTGTAPTSFGAFVAEHADAIGGART
jgi:uncharacterized protein YbjT (DUF2867 family)